MANILVTGGAGFIGSHVCKALAYRGHTPISLDNLCRGHQSNVKWGPLVEASIHNFDEVYRTLVDHQIEAVIHFAAFAYVGESVEHPEMYFENNVKGSMLLFEAMKEAKVKNIVFSSTCATYGESLEPTISEDHPQKPINPYGLSKLMVENLLLKYQEQGDLNFCGLRYFNAAGCDPEGELTERHDPEPHILPNIIRAGLAGEAVSLFGNDYPTEDGTCVRDFVHVSDLAKAHILCLEALLENKTVAPFYNLANTRGFSLLELVKETERTLGISIPIEYKERRPGDPATLVGNSKKFEQEFGWRRKHSDIKTMIKTATRGQKTLKEMNQDN